MVNATANPLRLRRNARRLEQLISQERVDIIHAYDAGAAWSARMASAQVAVWLVTSLPDAPSTYRGMRGRYAKALAQGDRIIASSNYSAMPIMERYGLRPDQITIVPRVIDTATYDPLTVSAKRAQAMRESWEMPRDDQVVLVPGRLAPWNGQILLPDIARVMVDNGVHGFVFAVVGETTSHAKYARDVLKRADAMEVGALVRLVGHVVAQAQAMGRPVITTDVGMLAEHIVAPPRMPDDVRTGWVVRPGDPAEFAHVLGIALSISAGVYRSMSARARQFAEYMFSPESVADAMRSVYTSLLARDF
jgi:glycosyltransferase involved in cell wall biosynthesis